MFLSLITPSFNQGAYLARTAESVLSQQGDFDLQWIVVDAESTDNTLDILRGIQDPRLSFTSEPDRGQAHAINKGMARANGDIVAWLNADDAYAPGALAAVSDAFRANPSSQWLIGNCDIIDTNDRPIRSTIAAYKRRRLRRFSYRSLLRENFVPQPAVFWRRDFGRQIGPLDESLHWTMDYDLWLRMARVAPPLVLGTTLSRFRLHPASKSGKVDRRQFDEGYDVAKRYLPPTLSGRVDGIAHRLNVEKIVMAYRLMRWVRL